MPRRTVLGGGVGVAAASLVMAGESASAVSGRVGRGPVRIGVLLDTSGPAATHGKRQLLGVRYQAGAINGTAPVDHEAGVVLLVRDTLGDVDHTRDQATELVDNERVDALIGTSLPATAAPVMELAQARCVPMVVPTTISPPTQPFVFCNGPGALRVARQIMASLAAGRARRAAVLLLDSLATPERLKMYSQQAAARGIELVDFQTFPGSATSLTMPLRRLTATNPDAIVVSTPPPFNGMAAVDVRALGWRGPLYCSTGAGHPGFLQQAGAAAEGTHVVAPWLLLAERAPDTLPNSGPIQRFVAGFTPENGPVGTFAGYGADAVGMLHTAYFGHRDRDRARARLTHLTYVGATGVYRMTPANHAGLEDDAITTVVVRNGTWAAG